jgi:hypothetical protein
MRRLLCSLIVLACAAPAAQAARPGPTSDCASFAPIGNLRPPDGRFACHASGQAPRLAVPDGRVIDPAAALKQGLMW